MPVQSNEQIGHCIPEPLDFAAEADQDEFPSRVNSTTAPQRPRHKLR